MPQIRLVAYDRSALNGSPLGEITEAASKHISVEFNDYGDGQFQISRHGDADQLVWTRPGRYIRAWLDTITGDPVASFFIEDSGDVVLAEGEDGVEDYVRQGRGPMRYLEEAIIWFESVTGSDAAAPDPDGIWLWPEVHPAGIMVRQLEEAQERGALPDLTYDFTRTTDSDGNPWTLLCDDFQLQAGDVNLGDLRGRLIELGLVFRMSHDFVLSAWEAGNVGNDLSGSITLSKGADIATSAEREQHWGDLKSTVLVKGKRGDTGAPVFVPVDSAAALTETTRRIEGYVDASETSGYDALQQIGQSAIYRNLRLHSGPTSLGVKDKTGQRALVDYFPGDTVTVDVPGIWNDEAKQVTSIALDETENGEYDPTVGFDEEPSTDSGSGAIAIKPLVPQATPECCPVPGPFVPVIVTDDTCPSPTAAGTYGPNLSATSVSPGNVFYLKPGYSDPGLVPNPGYVGSWAFPAYNSGGVDFAGDCTGNVARCLVIGDGVMVIHTATYSGSPRALTATLYHVVGGLPIADASVAGTTGDDFVVNVSSHDGANCTHYVDIGDDGGVCGGKWGFGGFGWTPATSGTVTNRPSHGQSVIEGWVGDGTTVDRSTNYPYIPRSIEVHVNGELVGVTETDPTTGEFTFDTAPPLGAVVIIRYQAASGVATGVGNNPTPDPYTPTSSGGGGLGDRFFFVDAYGAVHNGSTDDLAAFNAAIADLNAAGSGVLVIPPVDSGDYYYVSEGLDPITVPCEILGFGAAAVAASPIATDHATDNLFTLSHAGTRVTGLKLINYGGVESAGAAIAVTTGAGTDNRYDHLRVEGFYDGMDLIYGAHWSMSDVEITNPVRYGLRIANIDVPDGGDFSMDRVWFHTRSRNATAAVRQESAGGGKFTNVKVNCNSLADQSTYGGVKRYATGWHVYINGSANATSVMTGASCSFENVSGDGFLIETIGTGSFGLIDLSAIEFGLYSNNSGRCIKISAASNGTIATNGSIAGVVIDNITARTDGTARAAVELINTDRVVLGSMAITQGFTSRYTSSGDTNTTDLMAGASFATPAIVLGSSAAAGSAGTVIRSDATIAAFDATAPSTQAIGDSAATGSAAFAARRDHKHAMPSFGSPVAVGSANSDGVAATIARSDHVHQGSTGSGDHEHIVDVFNGDASTTAFELSQEPSDPEAVFAFVGGSWTAVTVSGAMNTTATFGSAPGSGTGNVVIQYPAVAA